jgi:hypothetical protein
MECIAHMLHLKEVPHIMVSSYTDLAEDIKRNNGLFSGDQQIFCLDYPGISVRNTSRDSTHIFGEWALHKENNSSSRRNKARI